MFSNKWTVLLLLLSTLTALANCQLREEESCVEDTTYPGKTKYDFLICIGGELISWDCPNGSIYDSSLAVCFSCQDAAVYAAENPNGFMVCSNGNLYYMPCTPGTVFHEDLGTCLIE